MSQPDHVAAGGPSPAPVVHCCQLQKQIAPMGVSLFHKIIVHTASYAKCKGILRESVRSALLHVVKAFYSGNRAKRTSRGKRTRRSQHPLASDAVAPPAADPH